MTVSIEILIEGDHDLTPKDVFPDGVPDNFAAEDVVAVMPKTFARLLSEWNLDARVTVIVREENPVWEQDEALFSDHAPSRWLESSAVAFE